MTGCVYTDLWLPEVTTEFFALLGHSRDVGSDVGNHFRAFEQVLRRGLDAAWHPVDSVGSIKIYVMYGKHALTYFAVRGTEAAVVKWMVIGTPYQQQQGLLEAKARAVKVFP